jgi:CDGSH-type Zn-finger protein/mannose-6-phosphate isomerase-like protein (cupin superfamily)
MAEPVVAGTKPHLVELKAGRAYAWCACGRSRRQPFCDGSHEGTGLVPLRFTADSDREAVLCACKRTASPPFCDGTHNSLSDKYEEASEDEIQAAASVPVTPRDLGSTGKAVLDGGCYVCTPDRNAMQGRGTLRIAPIIDESDGARFLSQYYAVAAPGTSGVLQFPGCDAVLFISDAGAEICISGRPFRTGPETGVYVRAGEAFRIHNHGSEPLDVLITACPQCSGPTWLDVMPEEFDESVPVRAVPVDPSQREPMADRFYQVLNGAETGCAEVTQFIGELPMSRAAAHRHLYEEAIMILSGRGFMWTEQARAEVQPGDVIFLPRKQLHSLECTSPDGMRLMGVFYPSGSPAVNY